MRHGAAACQRSVLDADAKDTLAAWHLCVRLHARLKPMQPICGMAPMRRPN